MIIRSVQLHNFRRYKDELIDLPNGIIGIVGNNGAGKSTIVEAIGWCLYGNPAARTNKEFIKRTSAGPSESCKVVVEMLLGDDTFRIERELKGANNMVTARLFTNSSPEPEVQGAGEVSEYVAKRTGMDYVAFYTSVFAKQKELNALSDLAPGERKRTIMRLLRIDKIDVVISQIRADMRESTSKIDFIAPTLKDLNQLEAEKQGLEKDKTAKSGELKSITQEASTLSQNLKDQRKAFATHEKKFKQHNRAEKQLTKLLTSESNKNGEKGRTEQDLKTARGAQETLTELTPQVQEFAQVEMLKEHLDGLQLKHKEKSAIEKQLLELKKQIEERISVNTDDEKALLKYRDAEADLRDNKRQTRGLNEKKRKLEAQINQLKAKRREYEMRKRKSEVEFSKIKNLGKKGKCPTCNRPLGEHLPEIVKHFTDEIRAFVNEIAEAKKQDADIQKEVSAVSADLKKKAAEEDTIRKMIKAKTSLKGSVSEGKKQLRSMERQMRRLNAQLKKYQNLRYDENEHRDVKSRFSILKPISERAMKLQQDVKRIPKLDTRVQSLTRSLSAIAESVEETKKKLSAIAFDKQAYEESKRSLAKANENYREKREKLVGVRGELSKLIEQIRQNAETITEEKGKRATIEQETQKIASRSKLEKIMVDFKSDLISRIRPVLSARSSELFRQMTKGKYAAMDLDDEYNIRIEDEGETFGIERFSGGEEDLANLCLRIAISQELAERAGTSLSGFIALDEVFGSQDSERKDSILKALNELSNQFRQILLITHIDDVKESLPFVLNVKDDGNGVVRIETEGSALKVPVQVG